MALVNYPSTAFHFTDPSSNEVDVSSTMVFSTDNTGNSTTMTPTAFSVTDNSLNAISLVSTAVQFQVSGASVADLSADASGNVIVAAIKPNVIVDASGPGTSGQVLTSTGSGIAWSDEPAAPGLAAVLAAGTPGDGGAQPISNVTSVGLSDGTSLSAGSLSLNGVSLGVSGSYLTVSTAADLTTPRTFDLKYLPMVVDGTTYFIQLFV
jgi:hypothetical protein